MRKTVTGYISDYINIIEASATDRNALK